MTAYELGVKSAEGMTGYPSRSLRRLQYEFGQAPTYLKTLRSPAGIGLQDLRERLTAMSRNMRPRNIGSSIGQGLRRAYDTIAAPEHKVQDGLNVHKPTYVTPAQQLADGAGRRNLPAFLTR
jgi:hypothetical protein